MEDSDTEVKHDNGEFIDIIVSPLNTRRAQKYLEWATNAQQTDNEVVDNHRVVKSPNGAFSENMQQFDSMIVEEVYVEFEDNRVVKYRRIFTFVDDSDVIDGIIYKSLESPIACVYRYFCMCVTGSGT